MQAPTPDDASKFAEEMWEDIKDEVDGTENSRYLAGVKDIESGNYILMMMVPPSALVDAVGPELHRTPNNKKFIAAISEEVLFDKTAEIEREMPDADNEEKNELMAEFLASFMPELFERAASMPELDI
jgi:hypothetical protein